MSEDGELDRQRRFPVPDSAMKKEDRFAESDRGVEVESRKSKSSAAAKSSVRKLRIKIVLPDRMTSKKDRVEEEHVCTLCRKGFRSKKALGGHMRVHAQRSTDHELKTTAGLDRAADSSETDDDDIEKDEVAEERSSDELHVVMRERKPICPICKKDFPSKKALFGHMRCHPERKWRGIQPPVYSSSSTVSDVQARTCGGVIQEEEEDEDGHDQHHEATMESKKRVIDLGKELLKSGWGTKAMRGREATTVKSSCAADHQFGNMVESNIAPDQTAGVQSLILLSRGCVDHKNDSTVRDSINFTKKLKFCGSELAESRGRKRKISEVLTAEEVSGLTNSANKKFKFANNEEDVNDHNKQGAAGNEHMIESDPLQLTVRPPDGYNASTAELMQIDSTTKKMHKVRKYLMVSDLKAMSTYNLPVKPDDHQVMNMEVVSDKERYKCATCNKSFSSHQALGGHKSSHNKLIRNAQGGDHIINSNSDAAAATILNLAAATHPLHQCNVCFKNYPTGQALGGHKRMHCSLVISKAPPPPVTVVPPPPSPPSIIHPEPKAASPLSPPAAPKAQASGNVHERCLLDLNEMPPAEDDEDHIAVVSQAVDISAAESKQDSGDDVHLSPSDPPSSV